MKISHLMAAFSALCCTAPSLFAQDVPTPTNSALPIPAAPKKNPFARWEKEIAAFEAADRKNPPLKGGVLFIGSSSIGKWKTLATDFPSQSVLRRGFGGSQIVDSAHFAPRIVWPYEPKMIVFYAGSNDIAAGKKPQELLAQWQNFVAQVRLKLPDVQIAYISIAPAPARWRQVEKFRESNALIENWTRSQPKMQFIDVFPKMLDEKGQPRPELFASDKLHMSRAGYELWREVLTPLLPPVAVLASPTTAIR